MGKKIIMGIMLTIIIVISGGYIYKNFINPPEPVKKVNVFKNASEKIDVEYIPYGSDSNECLLFITNNNTFQVHVTGTIYKNDENGVHIEDNDDSLNIDINPKQTYVIETVNPNNKKAREEKKSIQFDASNLKFSPVDGSDSEGKKSNELLLQDQIKIELFLDKVNDNDQPLIIVQNEDNKRLSASGYIVFYADSEKNEIVNVVPISFEDLPKKAEYRNYIYIGNSSSKTSENYEIYINNCA